MLHRLREEADRYDRRLSIGVGDTDEYIKSRMSSSSRTDHPSSCIPNDPTPSTAYNERPLSPQVITPAHNLTDQTFQQRLSTLSPEVLDLLQSEIGSELNIRELFHRLHTLEHNLSLRHRSHNTNIDISLPLKVDKPSLLQRMIPSCISRKIKKRNKGVGIMDDTPSQNHISDTKSVLLKPSDIHPAPDAKQPITKPSNLPTPPPHIDAKDSLQIAIWYHEQDELEYSVYYLELSASEGNPLGLFLLGMCLRHGLGIPTDAPRGLRCLIRSVEAAVVNLPSLIIRRKVLGTPRGGTPDVSLRREVERRATPVGSLGREIG
ncbi:hypothetical protein HK097_003876, partial [Rhizophlyctis rosea]